MLIVILSLQCNLNGGCECQMGFVRNRSGVCIPEQSCPRQQPKNEGGKQPQKKPSADEDDDNESEGDGNGHPRPLLPPPTPPKPSDDDGVVAPRPPSPPTPIPIPTKLEPPKTDTKPPSPPPKPTSPTKEEEDGKGESGGGRTGSGPPLPPSSPTLLPEKEGLATTTMMTGTWSMPLGHGPPDTSACEVRRKVLEKKRRNICPTQKRSRERRTRIARPHQLN